MKTLYKDKLPKNYYINSALQEFKPYPTSFGCVFSAYFNPAVITDLLEAGDTKTDFKVADDNIKKGTHIVEWLL